MDFIYNMSCWPLQDKIESFSNLFWPSRLGSVHLAHQRGGVANAPSMATCGHVVSQVEFGDALPIEHQQGSRIAGASETVVHLIAKVCRSCIFEIESDFTRL